MFSFSRAGFIIDFLAGAMVAVVILLLLSTYLVKYKSLYQWHRRIQLSLGTTLAVVLLVFEVHVRIDGWRWRAEASPISEPWINGVLYLHIAIASFTTIAWIYIIIKAMRGFDNPPRPGAHSEQHKRWARLGTLGMLLTAISGWIFFWMAFVAV